MIIDMNAWVGYWGTQPIITDVQQIRATLKELGISRILISPMHAVWCLNPHLCNDIVYTAAEKYSDVDPVPVLDPTIESWWDELQKANFAPRARWVKLVPAYSGYDLSAINEFFMALKKMNMGAIVQTRIEDPRRQHPLAQVPDTPVSTIVKAAKNNPECNFIIGGGSLSDLLESAPSMIALPNLYAEISQVDSIWGVKPLIEAGLTTKLLFGSHTPFSIPLASLPKLIDGLDQQTAAAILWENAAKLVPKKTKYPL